MSQACQRPQRSRSHVTAIAPTGLRATMPMRETISVTGGLVTASRTDFDPAELARRLGLNISDR